MSLGKGGRGEVAVDVDMAVDVDSRRSIRPTLLVTCQGTVSGQTSHPTITRDSVNGTRNATLSSQHPRAHTFTCRCQSKLSISSNHDWQDRVAFLFLIGP